MKFKNKIIECIYTRRSIREYKDKSVSKELIDELLKSAVMAPSAKNRQPLHFTIVEGKDKVRYFGEIAYKNLIMQELERKSGYGLKSAEQIFYNAPLLIIISGKKGYNWLKADANLAVQNMFLAANSLGLGSCWIGYAMPLNNDKKVMRELGVPDDFEIVAPLIFGYLKKKIISIPKREPKILKWIS
ncbi:MAG: nitroreductase family protein [archaeon]